MGDNEFEDEVEEQIQDIFDGGFIISDWDIGKDKEHYFTLIMEGKSGKKYKVIVELDSIEEEGGH